MNRKKPKTSHIGRHFIKAPQTMAWSDSQHRGWINSAGLGLEPQIGWESVVATNCWRPHSRGSRRILADPGAVSAALFSIRTDALPPQFSLLLVLAWIPRPRSEPDPHRSNNVRFCSTLTAEQVHTVVEFARQDRTSNGLRRFAIVMLLSECGLRAGEVVHLRLEDIDWRRECVRIRHSKTGAETLLPLLPSVGCALLDYLQHSRPQTTAREVFVRIPAPHIPLCCGSSLYTLIQRLLDKAGVQTQPKAKR